MKKLIIITALALLALSGAMHAKEVKQPESYDYTRGVEAYDADRLDDALDWLNREVKNNPKNGYAYTYIAIIRYQNDEYGKAINAINMAIKNIPKKDAKWRAMSMYTKSQINAAMGDTIQALDYLSQAIKIMPEEPLYYLERADIYFDLGRLDLADADYHAVLNVEAGNATAHMGLGRNALEREEYDEAYAQFSRVVKLDPQYSKGYSFRADVLMNQKKWNEAADDILKALDIDSDRKAVHLLGAFPDEARNIMASKLKIKAAKEPTNQLWPYLQAKTAQLDGNYQTAITHFQQANNINADAFYLKMIAKCYGEINDYTRALDYVEKAQNMDPDDDELLQLRAEYLSESGRYDECLEQRNRYVARNPDQALGYYYRAEDLMKMKRYKEAIDDYNTLIVILPEIATDPGVLLSRGDAYHKTGNDDLARADYNAIISQPFDTVPGEVDQFTYRAFAYAGLGDHQNAMQLINYALDNDSTHTDGLLYNKACVYARLGDLDNAMLTLRQAIDKGFDDVNFIIKDHDLEPLADRDEFKTIITDLEAKVRTQSTPNDKADAEADTASVYETVEVPFTKEGGVTKVKCTINSLPLYFIFDTGASDVTISLVEANFMLKNDFIKPDDIIGSARYIDANGDISEGTVINLRNVNFGGLDIDNVRASVVRNQKAPLLLGQSVLGRLGKIEIDNTAQKLIITHKTTK